MTILSRGWNRFEFLNRFLTGYFAAEPRFWTGSPALPVRTNLRERNSSFVKYPDSLSRITDTDWHPPHKLISSVQWERKYWSSIVGYVPLWVLPLPTATFPLLLKQLTTTPTPTQTPLFHPIPVYGWRRDGWQIASGGIWRHQSGFRGVIKGGEL